MKSTASVADVQSSGDAAFRYKMMREVIEAVRARGTLWMPLLNLVATFIDGLASGAPGKTRTACIAYLEAHFPDLCRALGAELFYAKYRCAAVHEFNLKSGFAIGRDVGLGGAYSGTQTLTETGQEIVVLNIDRLVADFLAHLHTLEQGLTSGGPASHQP